MRTGGCRCAGRAEQREGAVHGTGERTRQRGAPETLCRLLDGCVRSIVCSPTVPDQCGSRAETLVTAIEKVCADFAIDPSNVHRPVFRLWLAGMNNPDFLATLRARPWLRTLRYRPPQ